MEFPLKYALRNALEINGGLVICVRMIYSLTTPRDKAQLLFKY